MSHASRGLIYSVVVAAASAVVLGLMLRQPLGVRADTPLPDYGSVPDFALIDQRGAPIRRADLLDTVWVADFIFTRCAGQCPMMSAQLASLRTALRDTAGLLFISFSVDPDYDTPAVLAAYAARYAAQAAQWRFVTGPKSSIWLLAHTGFHLGVGEEGSAEEPITHSVRLVLVDRQGHIRGYYDATDAQAMVKLQQDARRLLRTAGS